ncbi:17 kDa [Spodoptera frugiperda ascovirus 1a]|uniref:17 kDa n=1 Tax=Spodoptera frugiperda ascovirus 1a TaxID=113370 RepID=Q0E532_SFAVA|nr:17 kDa [Spodoptera frugiperda ascovirus 1a]CAL44669.1 17 kDa [Spodoptera frugiperda ascovirus 1a]
MPAAKAFQTWNHNELLPKLCQDGEYKMARDAPTNIQIGMRAVHAATNNGAVAPWVNRNESGSVSQFDREFADAQIENFRLKLELTQTVAKYDAELAKRSQEMTQVVAKYDAELARVRTELALRNRDLAAERSSAREAGDSAKRVRLARGRDT